MKRWIAVPALVVLASCSSSRPPTSVHTADATKPKLPAGAPAQATAALYPGPATTYVLHGDLPALPNMAPAYRIDGTLQGLGGAVQSGVAYACSTDAPKCDPPPRPAGLPTREEADRAGRDALSRAGVDLATAKIDLTDGYSQWNMTARPVIDGLPTDGYTYAVSIGPLGALERSGWNGQPKRVGDYDLVGTAAGFQRLLDGFGRGPVPMAANAMPVCAPSANCPEPKPAEVVGAHLVLRLMSGSNASYLEPAYVFELQGGGETWAVPAVVETELVTPTR